MFVHHKGALAPHPDRTPGVGQGAGVEVELGIGADGTSPELDWDWTTCTYNEDKDGLVPDDLANDEYACAIESLGSIVGTNDFAMRVRVDEGGWTYCDLGPECGGSGSSDGYNVETAGHLEVTP